MEILILIFYYGIKILILIFYYNIKIIILIFYLLPFFFINLICIKAENEFIEKEKVLSLKLQSCKEDKDCINFSNKCYEGLCYYTFFCYGKNCTVSNENLKFENIKDNSNKVEKKNNEIIGEACTLESSKNGKRFTRLCNTDSDCFSNSCVNNVCIIKDNLSLTQCSNELTNNKIACCKAASEKCENNDECYYKYCKEDKTCNDLYRPDTSKETVSILGKYIIIALVIIVIIIILIVFLVKRSRKH